MSFPDANNPNSWQHPPKPGPITPVPLPVGPVQMEYLRSYNYIFENPNWLMNLVWGFLCILAGQVIPVIPGLVFMGYQYEVIEGLLASRGTRYPDFDINRFTDYLGRAIWPFLVTLLVVLVMMPVIGVVAGILFAIAIGIGAAAGEEVAGIMVSLAMIFIPFVAMLLSAVLSIASTPMILRAGLAQDFGAAFEFGWVKDFMRKMWMETLLSMLFLTFSAFVLVFCTCFIGAIVLGPLFGFASSHLWYQLYVLYLTRGGTPIPLKPPTPPMAQPGFAPPQQY